jgi:dipeptidyl aminopeptidase/acylaminoacyl peptidase
MKTGKTIMTDPNTTNPPHRTTVRIPAPRGEQLDAWLYEPVGQGPHPAVVMAHGMGAVKAGGLQPFAERFCREGFAVVVIDYRQWGDSTGWPRDELSVPREREDYGAAIGWAAAHPKVDAQRIFVWGTSFAGMHVTALAASDTRLAGAVAQSPLVDGLAGATKIRPSRSIRLMAVAVADWIGSLFGRTPIYVPINVPPGQWGVTDTPDAPFGKQLVTPREPEDWHNRLAARSLLSISRNRPIRRAASIRIPILLIVPETDTQAPVAKALRVAELAERAELYRIKGGHYDVYEGGAAFDEVLGVEVEFLRRHAGLAK